MDGELKTIKVIEGCDIHATDWNPPQPEVKVEAETGETRSTTYCDPSLCLAYQRSSATKPWNSLKTKMLVSLLVLLLLWISMFVARLACSQNF